MAKSPALIVTGPACAAVLKLSTRQFTRLVKAGVIPRHAPRQFDLATAVPAFVQYLRDGREGSGDLVQEKLRLTVAQRRDLEQRMRIRARQLVEIEDVERVFDNVMVLIASQLEGLPGRACGEVAGLTDPAQVRKVLLNETRRIRSAAADQLATFAHGAQGRAAAAPATDEDA